MAPWWRPDVIWYSLNFVLVLVKFKNLGKGKAVTALGLLFRTRWLVGIDRIALTHNLKREEGRIRNRKAMLHQDCIVTCDAFLSQSDIKKHTHFHNTSSSSQGFSYFVTTTKRVHHAPIQPPLFQSNDCSKTCQIFISITSHLKAEMCHR